MRVLITVLVCLSLLGCFSSSGPSNDQIQAQLSNNEIPDYWRIGNLNIIESENFGTDETPRVRSRFVASIEALEDLYFPSQSSQPLEAANNQRLIRINGKRIIELGAKDGSKLDISGIVTSTKRGDTWSTSFAFDEKPWLEKGQALYAFQQEVVIAGSDEEIAMLEEADANWREEQAKLKAEREAAEREIAKRNAPLLELVNTGFALMNYLSEKNGNGLAVLQFPQAIEADQRFEFTLTTNGGDIGMIGMVKDGRFAMIPQQGESGQSSQCGAVIKANENDYRGESDCYVFFGDLTAKAKTKAELDNHFSDANKALLNFFKRAENVKYYNYRTLNETFGGGSRERMLVKSVSVDNIELTFLARARDTILSEAIWYIQYGTVRSKTAGDKYYGLQLTDTGELKGRRYTRLNRPIALTVSAP